MRIAVMSDIHGNLWALDAVLADIERRKVDVTVNLGDILSGPLLPAETAARLMALDLPTIRGNHERQMVEQEPAHMGSSDRWAHERITPAQRDWIASLPASMRLADDVLMVHGTPGSDLVYWMETVEPEAGQRRAHYAEVLERAGSVQASLVLCGHTHIPRAVLLDGGPLVLNPGSVGLQAYRGDLPYPHAAENGTPHARYAIVERTAGGWAAEHHAVAYDWHAAADTAQRHGRPDWAFALRTGRMP